MNVKLEVTFKKVHQNNQGHQKPEEWSWANAVLPNTIFCPSFPSQLNSNNGNMLTVTQKFPLEYETLHMWTWSPRLHHACRLKPVHAISEAMHVNMAQRWAMCCLRCAMADLSGTNKSIILLNKEDAGLNCTGYLVPFKAAKVIAN